MLSFTDSTREGIESHLTALGYVPNTYWVARGFSDWHVCARNTLNGGSFIVYLINPQWGEENAEVSWFRDAKAHKFDASRWPEDDKLFRRLARAIINDETIIID
ncbi:hypothetical protein AWB82_06661 [Caballeronia glebae]|jgi:hypothetical protein|uniref:Uncharacterized protein n=1 Tax=Caballeronia glebae TaxID=1777143 RepID=A0A158DGL5_9BURK|nr:hypothetical protein AWB82_06661 [Caballeronia glebae]